MNNKELIAELASRTSNTQQSTQRMVLTLMECILEELEEKESVQVPQFGTFEVKKRDERVLVNPNSGKKMLVPPKLVLAFRPTSSWKSILQKGGTEDE